MTIAELRQTSSGRFTIRVDSGEEIKTTLDAVQDMRLSRGMELGEAELEAIRLASRRALARERALDMLSRRQMSGAELKRKLTDKGEDEDTADYCVAWLSERALINDAEYAAAVTRHYAAKGYGSGRVRAELSRRGVARELWDDALAEMPETESGIDRFIASRLSDPNDKSAVRRLSQALFRRGFSWNEIRRALERHKAEIDEEEE